MVKIITLVFVFFTLCACASQTANEFNQYSSVVYNSPKSANDVVACIADYWESDTSSSQSVKVIETSGGYKIHINNINGSVIKIVDVIRKVDGSESKYHKMSEISDDHFEQVVDYCQR